MNFSLGLVTIPPSPAHSIWLGLHGWVWWQIPRAPGEEKPALKEVKETLRHLPASNRPLQNSLLMSLV